MPIGTDGYRESTNQRFASIGAVDYLKSMVHTTAVNITKMFGITGRVISSSTACTTSSQSIGYGYEAIRFGRQDAMICGGSDEYDTTTVAVFDNLLACSTAFNATPTRTPRPFDVERDGLVVGEGAGTAKNASVSMVKLIVSAHQLVFLRHSASPVPAKTSTAHPPT